MSTNDPKRICPCGGVITADNFCTLCGFSYREHATNFLDGYASVSGMVDRAFAKSNIPAREADPGHAYCAECNRPLTSYICYTCDKDLINYFTQEAEYHPYLWEMDPGEQALAHALGVAL